MNIQAQLCGIILLVIMIIFYVRYKSLRLNTQIMFQILLVVTLLCVFFDMISILAIVKMLLVSRTFVVVICKTYLSFLVLVGLAGLLYQCADIWQKQKKFLWVTIAAALIALAEIVLIICLPINIIRHGRNVYTAGPSVLATYMCVAVFMVGNFLMTVIKSSRIDGRRKLAVRLWLAICVVAAGIQFFNNELLLVGYALAVGIMVIFLILENPEFLVDRTTRLYNQSAMLLYAEKLYNKDKKFAVLSVWFSLGVSQADDEMREQRVMVEFARRLPDLPNTKVFKMSDDEAWLIFDSTEQIDATLEKFKIFIEGGRREIGSMAQVEYIYVPDSRIVCDAQELFHLMQYAKWKGKEQGNAHFRQLDKAFVEQMKTEEDMEVMLREALTDDRIEVFYQPIYSTKEQKFVSAEALVRMRDKAGALVPPSDFIPVAESNGMILELGETVFRKVCRFFVEQRLEQYGIHYIEVNLSVVQCAYQGLSEDFIAIMKEYGVDPKYINLEITESASLSAKQLLLENMEKLIDYGVHFSLDDFGTGQSNLNYIVDMPVDIVKFDREMSQAFFKDEKAKYVMNAAMQMIQGMELQIVSEGIEEAGQYEAMEKMNIDYIQGFYFSKPLPEKEFLEFIIDKCKSSAL